MEALNRMHRVRYDKLMEEREQTGELINKLQEKKDKLQEDIDWYAKYYQEWEGEEEGAEAEQDRSADHSSKPAMDNEEVKPDPKTPEPEKTATPAALLKLKHRTTLNV